MPPESQTQRHGMIAMIAVASAFLCCLAVVLSLTADPAWAQIAVGTITSVDGAATLVRNGRESAVTQGMAAADRRQADYATRRAPDSDLWRQQPADAE